ncbi:MAG: glycosyltransferase family 4 protein [Bryobacteraceae bacterium]
MHVGVDACCWLNRRGYGRHARSLFDALLRIDTKNRYTMVVDSPEAVPLLPARAEPLVVAAGGTAVKLASADGRRSLSYAWRMARAIAGGGFEMLIFPTVYTFVPVPSRAPKIIFIHDVIPETFPDLTTPGLSARLWWRTKVLSGIGMADLIVTVSAVAREGIVRRFGVDPDRVKVAGEAADPVFRIMEHPAPTERLLSPGFDASRRHVVHVGGFSPHKNLAALVEAFRSLAASPEFDDCDLWLAGDTEGDTFLTEVRALRARTASAGLASRIVFTGFLPDQDLVALLNLASVLAMPSLMEGFGLPAMEAAQCGCPVIAAGNNPAARMLGAGALLVDPPDAKSLEGALRRVLVSGVLRASMGRTGLEASRHLSWDTAARTLLGFMEMLQP